MRSEWTKLCTLRSTRWSLLAGFVSMAGLGILVAAVQMSRWTHLEPHDRATYNSIDPAVGGWHLAQLAIGVLGVLVISGEYSTGMIRSSLMAVPRRLPVLWAKIAVFAAVTFVADADRHVHLVLRRPGDRRPSTISSTRSATPGALRVVFGSALFLTVLGHHRHRARRAGPQHRRRHRALRRAAVRPARDHGDPAGERRRRDQPLPAAQRRDHGGHDHLRQPPSLLARGAGSRCSAATRHWRSPRPPSPCSDATPDRDAGRGAGVP